MSLLLTDNASPGSSDGMMPGFPVEEGGGYGKIGDCSDIAYFTYFLSMDRKHVTVRFVYIKNILVLSVENALCLKMVRLITTSA